MGKYRHIWPIAWSLTNSYLWRRCRFITINSAIGVIEEAHGKCSEDTEDGVIDSSGLRKDKDQERPARGVDNYAGLEDWLKIWVVTWWDALGKGTTVWIKSLMAFIFSPNLWIMQQLSMGILNQLSDGCQFYLMSSSLNPPALGNSSSFSLVSTFLFSLL